MGAFSTKHTGAARAAAPGLAMLLLALVGASMAAALEGCSRKHSGGASGAAPAKPLQIGFVGSPVAAPLYVAEDRQAGASGATPEFEVVQFKSSADIGYALLSGDLDAGLLEPSKAEGLLERGASGGLKVAGEIQFPYGATVVLRKDLSSLRLSDLEGRKLAVEGDDCQLYHEFSHDAKRLGVDISRIELVFMPFDDMLPALESKTVDAILTKGAYGAIGESLGHSVLYQKWDVEAGEDECCPAILAQTAYYLVVRPLPDEEVARLVQRLEATNLAKPSEARALVCKRLGLKQGDLSQFPVASFAPLSDSLRSYLKHLAWKRKP